MMGMQCHLEKNVGPKPKNHYDGPLKSRTKMLKHLAYKSIGVKSNVSGP